MYVRKPSRYPLSWTGAGSSSKKSSFSLPFFLASASEVKRTHKQHRTTRALILVIVVQSASWGARLPRSCGLVSFMWTGKILNIHDSVWVPSPSNRNWQNKAQTQMVISWPGNLCYFIACDTFGNIHHPASEILLRSRYDRTITLSHFRPHSKTMEIENVFGDQYFT